MKLCLCQGTFNPIHNAHINIAKHAYDTGDYDKILFIPAFIPPQKTNFGEENARHRLEMLKIATDKYPYFEVSDIEFKRNKTSYTYDTVVELYNIFDLSDKPSFLIGSDAFKNIETWYKSDELKHLLNFKLFVRENNFDETSLLTLKRKGYNYELMNLPYCNISSSVIREKIKSNENVCDIIPDKVWEYIKQNELYKIYN